MNGHPPANLLPLEIDPVIRLKASDPKIGSAFYLVVPKHLADLMEKCSEFPCGGVGDLG